MPDQNQQQNPQNQGIQQNQNQDTNDNIDMFGGDYDILENSDLLQQIDDLGIGNENDNFDDDINVDYRNQVSSNNEDLDTMQNTEPEIVQSQDNDDLGDLDLDFDDLDDLQENQTGDDVPVYDEPDNPNDYVSPDDMYDNINIDSNDSETEFDDFDPTTSVHNTPDTSETTSMQDTIDLDDISENNNIGGSIDNDEMTENNVIEPAENTGDSLDYQDIDDDDFDVDIPNTEDIVSEDDNMDYNQNTQYSDETHNERIAGDIDVPMNTDNKESNNTPSQSPQTYEIDTGKSNLQNKFAELQFETNKIFQLVNKDLSKGFDLLGANDDRQKIIYTLFISDDDINIRKVITDKTNNSNTEHFLTFKYEDSSINVYIDDEILFREVPELQNDDNKNKQVSEKLNKFIFLVTEEYKKIRKEKQAKEKDNEKKAAFREF